MFAFVQRKPCGGCLRVRVGPLAKQYGDPWVRKIEGVYEGRIVTFEAFEQPEDAHELSPKMFEAAVNACFADGFEEVHLDRIVPHNPRHLVFTKGENGEIRMSKVKKEKIPHVSEIFKPDGTLNVPVATFGLAHAMGQDAAGHISISNGSATQVENADGSVDVTIKFRRNHH